MGRCRASVFRQRGTIAVSMRLIPAAVLSLQALGLPGSVVTLADESRGLVLVTGVTGSGKSTTLAALIDLINRTRPMHILTIEDPIEFVHADVKAVVTQREIGFDTPSYPSGLCSALRQDPDVILIGEMRDLETIETALVAAETGHLVFATLHTLDASETVNRIISAFPPHQQGQIRQQLARVLRAAISQRLLPRADGRGRALAAEVLIAHALHPRLRRGPGKDLPHRRRDCAGRLLEHGMHGCVRSGDPQAVSGSGRDGGRIASLVHERGRVQDAAARHLAGQRGRFACGAGGGHRGGSGPPTAHPDRPDIQRFGDTDMAFSPAATSALCPDATCTRARLVAITLLSRREYTAHEVRTRLVERGCAEDVAGPVVDALVADGAIDDRRAAGAHLRTAARIKGRGRHRIERELAARGVAKTLISELVADLTPASETEAIRRILVARAPAKPDLATRRRLFQHLLRRGFSADAIGKVLRTPDGEDD